MVKGNPKHHYKHLTSELRALTELVIEYESALITFGIHIAKTCVMCGKVKPRSEFYPNKGALNTEPYCKACRVKKNRKIRTERRQQPAQPPAPLFDAPTAPEPAPVTLDDKIARIRMMSGE